MRASSWIFVTVVLTLPLQVTAQIFEPGERVRVRSADGGFTQGVVSSVSQTFIIIRPEAGGPDLELSISEASRIERSVQVRRFGRNFGLTMGASAAAGGLLAALSWSGCSGFCIVDSRADAFAAGVAGGALIGLPLGLIVGLSATGQGWEPLSAPATSGTGISFSPVAGAWLGVSGAFAVGGGGSHR